MKIEETKHLEINLEGKDIDIFKSIMKKISDNNTQVGFKRSPFDEDEKKFIEKNIKDKF